jgi:hypothetical protein
MTPTSLEHGDEGSEFGAAFFEQRFVAGSVLSF